MNTADGRQVVSTEEAASLLVCTVDEVERWRRAVLPTGPRKRAGQADDEYRAEEIVAVAAGQWLESMKRREALPMAARLVSDPPADEAWCILVTYRTVQLITDPAHPELAKRRYVREVVFHPDALYAALRERGVWPPAPATPRA